MPIVPLLKTESFPDYSTLSQYLSALKESAPHLVKVMSIGRTRRGRELLVTEVTNSGTGEAGSKPSLWIDGNSNGYDLGSTVACLSFVRHLVSEYGRDEAVTDALDNYVVYVLPCACPDLAEECVQTGDCPGLGKMTSPAGWKRSDIDGDGRILQMRCADASGDWKSSQADPNILVPRQLDDKDAVCYRLYSEGTAVNSDEFEYLECLNALDSSIQYRLAFMRAFGVKLAISLRGGGQGIGYLSEERLDKFDKKLGNHIAKLLGKWVDVPVYESDDPFLERLYRENGAWGFTASLWDIAKLAGVDLEASDEELQLRLLEFCRNALEGYGWSSWRPFVHPQLDCVELGGWDWLHLWRNPPVGKMLSEYCAKHLNLLLGITGLLPKVSIQNVSEEVCAETVDVSEQSNTLRLIEAEIINSGYLSTGFTGRGKRIGVGMVLAELLLPRECTVTAGQNRVCFDSLSGLTDTIPEWRMESSEVAGNGICRVHRLRWAVSGDGEVALRLHSYGAGGAVYCFKGGKKDKSVRPAVEYRDTERRGSELRDSGVSERTSASLGSSGEYAAVHLANKSGNAVGSSSLVKPVAVPSPVPEPIVPKNDEETNSVPVTRTLGSNKAVSPREHYGTSTAAMARNISLVRGVVGDDDQSRTVSSDTSVVRPVNLLSRTEETVNSVSSRVVSGQTVAPSSSPLSGYRPTMRRSVSSEESGTTVVAPERTSALIREEVPARRETTPGLGRVFGQSNAPKTPPPPSRATLGRPVGQSEAERRQQLEDVPPEVTTYEGHEVKPHSLLGGKKKVEREESTPSEPRPIAPLRSNTPSAPLLLRRVRDDEEKK